ncbi:MAG: LamG domain-containing protein, partial [Bacteroidetes bacterium]
MFFAAGLNAQTMVANYSFGGHANDESATANHASVHGVLLAPDRFGWANNAFSFDGVQGYLEAPNHAALNSDYTTVAFWINANEIPVTGEVYPLSFGGWQDRWKISLPNHGKLIWTTNNTSGISDMDTGDGNELTPGIWTHVVMVHDGTKDLIYVNGVLANEKDVEGTMNSTDKPLGIGYNPIDSDNFFNGFLDEVQIYDYALSAGEIETLFNTQSVEPVLPNAIVADYSFSGDGRDGSGFGNHGLGTDVANATDRFGYGNSAMSFNGTSSTFEAPNSAQLNSDYVSIGFWVKVNALPASGEVYLMSHGGWQDRFKISLPSHGKPVFTTNATSGISDMDSGDGNALVEGVWTHVAMIHDGTKDRIYINGALANEKDVEGTLNPTEHPLGVGFNPIDGGNYFDGVFDEVQIINYALSDLEVAAAFAIQSTFPGDPDDNLVAEYLFSGDANDGSQFGNHAINNGAAPAMDRFGLASNAMEFTGAEGVMAVNSTALNSDNTTISFWINV